MAKNSTILLVLIFTVGLIGSGLIIPECFGAGSSSLTVRVENQSDNSPIANANVSISGPENHTATTGANGIVIFSNIAAGTYQVLATAPTYPNKIQSSLQVNGDTKAYAAFSFTRAFFVFSPSQVIVNHTVSFDASVSNTSGIILAYDWDFGDHSKGSGVTPAHVYTKGGTYNVFLTVTSNVGTATYSRNISVSPGNENGLFPWILLIIPFLIPIPIILLRRRRYYVVIQARIPPTKKHVHCPGDGTKCEDCKLTPC